MTSVEAPKELQVRIFNRLGNHQYVFTLHLQGGDDVQTRVLEVFQQGHLPGCLYRSTLEYAVLAVRESLVDAAESLQTVLTPANTTELPTAAIHSGRKALEGVLLDIEERQWPKLKESGIDLSKPTKEMFFWCAYDFLLRHRPRFFRTIGTLEESYLKGNRDLQVGRMQSIQALHFRQSIEMERVRVQAEEGAQEHVSRDVQFLVAQHVSELDAVELHWRTEIEELKVRQKASYRELVVDRFEQDVGQIRQVRERRPFDVESSDSDGASDGGSRPGAAMTNLARPLLRPSMASAHAAEAAAFLDAEQALLSGDMPEQTEDNPENPSGRLQAWAEVRTVFGQRKVFFVLRLWVGDILDLLQPAETLEIPTEDYCDGAGPQLPPELVGLGSYGYEYFVRGSALPERCRPMFHPPRSLDAFGLRHVPRDAKLDAPSKERSVYQSPSLQFWGVPAMPKTVRLSSNAYAARLRGLVIPTPENLKFDAGQAVMLREFTNRCDEVTDLHFPPIREQLELVKDATHETPLRASDYFCTRNSNQGGYVQVAFHLLMSSSDAPATDEVPASIHRAIKRIICDCHRCHVVELSLPLLLLDIGTSESSLPYAVAQRRCENALRALKGALTRLAEELAPSESPELQVINLVLPHSCAASVNAAVPSVAESTLTFLQHSFQCV